MVPLTEPCALRSTQPLKVSTRDFFWGKFGRCIWLTTYHPCSAKMSRKSGALTYPEPLGPPWPVVGHLYFTSTAHNNPANVFNKYYFNIIDELRTQQANIVSTKFPLKKAFP